MLDGCTVSGDIIGQGWMDYGSYHTGYLHIIDTVVDGGIAIDLECYAESPFGSVNFTHATIAGAVSPPCRST